MKTAAAQAAARKNGGGAMTQNVLISITGVQMTDDGPQEVEMITTGDYFGKDGRHYVLYEEMTDDGSDPVRNTIRIQPDSMSILKKGEASTRMVFEKNKKNLSCYVTPFGQMMIGIHTGNVQVREEEDLLKVDVDYSLDINYEHVSDCNITLEVRPRA